MCITYHAVLINQRTTMLYIVCSVNKRGVLLGLCGTGHWTIGFKGLGNYWCFDIVKN